MRRRRQQIINFPYSALWIIFVPVVYGLSKYFKKMPTILERIYAVPANKIIMQFISRLTGQVSFSFAEIFVLFNGVALIVVCIVWSVKLIRGGAGKLFYRVLVYICMLYVLFMAVWGLNYSRMPVSELLGYEIRLYRHEEIYQLAEALIVKANDERSKQVETPQGIMRIQSDVEDLFNRAQSGYDVLGKRYEIFRGNWGRPKPILLSEIMLYTGITGIFMPYTGEANVNVAIPDLLLPAVTMHEKAHQMGIAPEDEANFIAYLACVLHPDADYRYSGTVLALIYTLNAINEDSPEDLKSLRKLYSEALKNDLENYSAFWEPYKGKVNDTADKMNDTYLKSNHQKDGVKSYARMVDLLLADFIQRGTLE